MPKHKVKVRFRWIWTVYYDMKHRGNVTSASFKSETLALQSIARTLKSWLKTAPKYDDTAETTREILDLLTLGNDEAIEEARNLYAEMVEAPEADRVWMEKTRLVVARG